MVPLLPLPFDPDDLLMVYLLFGCVAPWGGGDTCRLDIGQRIGICTVETLAMKAPMARSADRKLELRARTAAALNQMGVSEDPAGRRSLDSHLGSMSLSKQPKPLMSYQGWLEAPAQHDYVSLYHTFDVPAKHPAGALYQAGRWMCRLTAQVPRVGGNRAGITYRPSLQSDVICRGS